MQCKDIPDVPVLQFLLTVHTPEEHNGALGPGWKTWVWSDDYKPANSVVNAMPAGVDAKLALAKMKVLIKRGLAKGCTCGCRGDFEITEKGLAMLQSSNNRGDNVSS